MEAAAATRERQLLDGARAGDEASFQRLVEGYRGELHAHCYRMLGSVHDAEDAMQETLLRAWRGIAKFEGRSSLRSWLYTIATNTSLNLIEPYPDERVGLEDGLAGPEASYERRESVELAFVAALQHLPPNQRAVLILREVLGYSAKETAATLETTTAAVNSALQRARATIEERLPEQSQQETLRALGDEKVREIVDQYVDAWERADVDAVVSMLTEDAAFTMPPMRTWFGGRDQIATFLRAYPLNGQWRWKPVVTQANGQPALAYYSWDEDEGAYLPFALNVLTFRGEEISEVDAFITRSAEDPDPEVLARMPEQDFEQSRLSAAFVNLNLPERLN